MRSTPEITLNHIVQTISKLMPDDLSLADGKTGMLVFYAYLYLEDPSDDTRERIEDLLESILTDLDEDDDIDLSYANGITGLLTVIAHFRDEEKLSFLRQIQIINIREPVFIQAKKWIAENFIDNLYGAVGIIHYFNQLNDPLAEKHLSVLIHDLLAKVVKIGDDRMYFTSSFTSRDMDYLDFGLAHGMSGLLTVLLDVYEKGRFQELLAPVIVRGIHYILESKIQIEAELDNYSLFPSGLDLVSQEYTLNNRLGWCYGDLNQVLLFYKAGRILKRKEFTEYAEIFGMATLSRKSEVSTQINESGFCHGAAGLSFIYLHLYQITAEPMYQKAHEEWMDKTLLFFEEEYVQEGQAAEKLVALLDGLPGIGLVLLSTISRQQLNWSKLLFI